MKEQKVDWSHCEWPNIFPSEFNIQKGKGGLGESFLQIQYYKTNNILHIFHTIKQFSNVLQMRLSGGSRVVDFIRGFMNMK